MADPELAAELAAGIVVELVAGIVDMVVALFPPSSLFGSLFGFLLLAVIYSPHVFHEINPFALKLTCILKAQG